MFTAYLFTKHWNIQNVLNLMYYMKDLDGMLLLVYQTTVFRNVRHQNNESIAYVKKYFSNY